MGTNENLHEGHRQRMFARFKANGFQGFQEHEILELMLFYAIPRVNTNDLAHRLLKEYGSLSAVCNAPTYSLLKIPELGEKGALFLHILPEFVRAFEISATSPNIQVLRKIEDSVDLFSPYFIGLSVEKLYIMVLDDANRILGIEFISEGDSDTTTINLQKIIDTVMKMHGSKLILAHNHPGSVALPSDSDIMATISLQNTLKSIRVKLLEHIIFSASIDNKSAFDSLLLFKSGCMNSF